MEFEIKIPNREYQEFVDHGEIWLQNKLKGKLDVIFDVGCNMGHWSTMAKYFNPDSEIHMFELSPTTYKSMITTTTIQPNVFANGFGLSDNTELLPFYNNSYSPMATAVTQGSNHSLDYGITVTGDDYVLSRKIDKIDFLKIDVEGWEGNVMKGFKSTLESKKIKIIQFEYTYMCVLTKWLLIDSYKFLEPYGYKLGKLHNGHIEFHDYGLIDETFQGPEYVAILENEMDLLE